MRHDGAFADLGRPSDFLRATLEALAGAFPFPPGAGDFDAAARVLTLRRPATASKSRRACSAGCAIGAGARIAQSAVWSGVEIGPGARLSRCLAAGGVVRGRRVARGRPSLGPARRGRLGDSPRLTDGARAGSDRGRERTSLRPSPVPAPVVERPDLSRSPVDAHDGHPVVPVPEIDRARRGLADGRERADVRTVEADRIVDASRKPPRAVRVRDRGVPS